MATGGQFSAGIHAVQRLIRTHPTKVRKIFVDERSRNERVKAVIAEAGARGIQVHPVRNFRLDDMAKGTAHQGLVAALKNLDPWDEARLRTKVETALQAGETPVLLVLDDLQDPHNLGACLRTADACGVLAVVVARDGAAGMTPAVRKVASGGAESVPLVAVRSTSKTLEWLRSYGLKIVGTSDTASGEYWDVDLAGPTAIVMGTESTGLSPPLAQRCDHLVSMPMQGLVESLNVSVATGLMLYEVLRQRRD
ncbi:MAG: 23S rRNA (guanosine(2251)-2'-O)-methyltransferase RlmB [Pseudomonadota bacterium]